MKISVQSFSGIAPRINPRYLPDGWSVIAEDVEAFGQSLKPIHSPGAALVNLAKPGAIQTIYKFGQDNTDETKWWFHWDKDVDVCRSQIAGDTSEWTFYTGDGYPKATYNAIAIAGTSTAYPVVSRRLGLPAPAAKPTVTANNPIAEGYAAELVLTASHISQFTKAYGLRVSTNDGASFVTCALNGAAPAIYTIPAESIATMTAAYGVKVSVDNGVSFIQCTLATNAPAPAALALAINNAANDIVTAEVTGTSNQNVTVTSKGLGTTIKLLIRWGVSSAGTATGFDAPSAVNVVTALTVGASAVVTAVVSGTGVKVTSVAKGATAKLLVRWGSGVTESASATGGVKDLGTLETRVYCYTWIASEASLVQESMPSPASSSVDVYPSGKVNLSGFSTPPSASDGYLVTGARFYRATEGAYLFVKEVPIASITGRDAVVVDDVAADALGEPCPSIGWEPPKATLKGLCNLPNGMVAGFDGRDVFFCEPFRPYAWPSTYMQTVDYPVVGFGRIDTTLVVLTTGTPYFMQGSSPAYVVTVKSDVEQACISKRSIVSLGGAVYYASPDGLVALAPGGSKVVTSDRFDRTAWQRLNPSSIHAYSHDNKYYAFYVLANGKRGGFIYCPSSGSFTTHTIGVYESGALGAYADLRADALYLVNANRQIVKWGAGIPRVGFWRSKVFAMPQITGFSCIQVEMTDYVDNNNVLRPGYTSSSAVWVYCDGVNICAHTLSNRYTGSSSNHRFSSRNPLRIPAVQGREWQFHVAVSGELHNVVLAQSQAEIATA